MRAGIALGSNLGDRAAHLQEAQRAILELPAVDAGKRPLLGPTIETAPVDCPPGSPPFLNTVMEVEYTRTAAELLRDLLRLERAHGRPALRARNAPRALDLDLLYAGDETSATAELTLPHPRIATRRFVLEPLAAIRPDLVFPGYQTSVADLLRALDADDAAARP